VKIRQIMATAALAALALGAPLAQAADVAANAADYLGVAGHDRFLGGVFTRFDGKFLFPRGRAANFVQVGAHGGQIIDRYRDLSRGPRLDDTIVLVEANSESVKRLAGRIRMDSRLLLKHGAAWSEDGAAWFAYAKAPNAPGVSGAVSLTLPANATAASSSLTSEPEGRVHRRTVRVRG
jgi:hypothetical protein